MGIDPATMMMASAVVSSVGTYSNIQNVKAANQRERVRYERERKIAKLQAIEEENMRKDMLKGMTFMAAHKKAMKGVGK